MAEEDEEAAEEVAETKEVVQGGLWKLYCSRALTAWGDRLWAFGLALFLFKVRPQDLLIVALYGLINCAVTIALGASLGGWIDATGRLRAAKVFLVVQNSSVAAACLALSLYFYWLDYWVEQVGEDAASLAIAAVTMAISLVSTLASIGSKIVVEKDWIVVIAGGDNNKLALMNSIFRTIDLVCLTLTPTLAGILFDFTSYLVAALFIGGWNLVSVFLEVALLVSIHRQFPALSETKPSAPATEGGLTGSLQAWRLYFLHPTRLAGLGLALLYMTVLGFDAITWGYMLLQCVPESVLGGMVAVSALVGVLGAAAFPPLRRWLGVERAGVVGMACLVATLALCVASVWLAGSPFDPQHVMEANTTMAATEVDCSAPPPITSVAVLLSGIILARFGLWVADLAVCQIQQEQVEEEKRGVIGGVQNSLQQLFNLAKFLLVILMPNPHMFGVLILLSFAFVALGGVSLTAYAGARGRLACGGYQAARTQEEPEEPLAKPPGKLLAVA